MTCLIFEMSGLRSRGSLAVKECWKGEKSRSLWIPWDKEVLQARHQSVLSAHTNKQGGHRKANRIRGDITSHKINYVAQASKTSFTSSKCWRISKLHQHWFKSYSNFARWVIFTESPTNHPTILLDILGLVDLKQTFSYLVKLWFVCKYFKKSSLSVMTWWTGSSAGLINVLGVLGAINQSF